jgi:hypothetical protein
MNAAGRLILAPPPGSRLRDRRKFLIFRIIGLTYF